MHCHIGFIVGYVTNNKNSYNIGNNVRSSIIYLYETDSKIRLVLPKIKGVLDKSINKLLTLITLSAG
ncbi:MAG TPA: hypothetical protein VFK40_14630 [Nitrososphaeraceae archaeon]|nr:hypothetical protein [Nitrososphaeraceae archaeon]